MSDDILARLKEMAAGGDPAAVKEAPKAAKPKVATVVPTPMEPEEVTGVPQIKTPVVSTVKAPAKVVAKDESGVKVPVVVLDDASTFSNLAGAKVCFVDPAADEVSTAEYSFGVSIADLLAMRDALAIVLKVVNG